MTISALFFMSVTFIVNPTDPGLKFDGYKVERHGQDYVITGTRPRSELYARYDEPQWRNMKAGEVFVRNPAFETRFLNVNTTSRHGQRDFVAATGCNLVQLGRLSGVSFEETFPEVFAALPPNEQIRLQKAKRGTQRSAAAQVRELAELDIPAFPLLYGCDAMKWNRTLCEAFVRVYPSAKAVNPPKSWEKGILCPSDPATARFIEAFVYEVASNAPYEGIVATFWDDYGLNCHCARCQANGNDQFGNQVAFAVGCYERACAKAKRKLIVRTWASGAAHWLGDEWVHAPGYGGPTGEPLSVWGKAYANLSPDTIIQAKVYNADCQPNAPFSRLLGELGKVKPANVELAEWQITGQTLGLQWLPASVVDDTAWRMKEARRRVGPHGGVALYAGGYKNRGYDALDDIMNSVNLYAWRELSWNPEKSVDAIWTEWSQRTFGKVEPNVIAALKASERSAVFSFSPLGLGAPTESIFANSRTRRETLLKYTNRYFLPEGEAALAPTEANIDRVIAEKNAALTAVEGMHAALQQADLPPSQKDEMVLRTDWLRAHLKVSRALDGALWRLRYLETLAPTDKRAEVLRREIAADFETVRTQTRELFAGAVGRMFSFYADPVQERQVTLGSPIGLIRDIRDQAMGLSVHARADGGVRYRGVFINDEDWGLRPWAVKHFGTAEQIGTNAYEEVFRLMQADGLNLLWPAMHEGGYEFSARPENFALADKYGITIGTSHCEPMLRNNCYLSRAEQKRWSWHNDPAFLTDYWREGVRRGEGHRILWTIGMRGIHDGRMPDGKTTAEKKAILEEVFSAQMGLLPSTSNLQPPTLFCPYKEVLPIFNAGLRVPDETIILWTNDNFGYIRRLGGPQVEGRPQGLYWHASYYGHPHSYTHLCTTPPAFMWYELCAKAWANGVRDVWMLNVGDVFPAELLMSCYGQLAGAPEIWNPGNVQADLLSRVIKGKWGMENGKLSRRMISHLNEYYALGFNRRPEHMCIQWTTNLPQSVKSDLFRRYRGLLAEDLSLERAIKQSNNSNNQTLSDEYFRLIGFQARFLAYAGLIHLEGKDKSYARSVLDPLMARWNALEGGKWSGLWCDTIEEHPSTYQPTRENRWSSQMQWPWNEPTDPHKKDRKGVARSDYVATSYRANVPEPKWLDPVVNTPAADGAWTYVPGLGTSGRALALLPVKPGVGLGARLAYRLPSSTSTSSLVLQFLPDFALWPGLKLGVNVCFDGGAVQSVAVPKSDSNLGEKDPVRAVAVQDNFIRVAVPIPEGVRQVEIISTDPGVVIDRVGVR